MTPTGPVRGEATPSEGGVQPSQEGLCVAMTVKMAQRLEEIFRKRHNPLFNKSFKDGILKTAAFLLLLGGERASEETPQCLLHPASL